MSSESRLGRQIEQVIDAFDGAGTPFALIGGLALAPHGVIRATQDVDLLIDASHADTAEGILTRLGYHCIYRSGDAGNYQRNDERVDLLYAQRPIARRLLAEAPARQTPFGMLRVVGLEGLIGFKLQGLVDDPRRTQDLEDIRALLRANRDSVDLVKCAIIFACSTGRNSSMRSSKNSLEQNKQASVHPAPCDGDGPPEPGSARDPFEQLDDLMVVVEGLCPRWPSREPIRIEGSGWLL